MVEALNATKSGKRSDDMQCLPRGLTCWVALASGTSAAYHVVDYISYSIPFNNLDRTYSITVFHAELST